MLKSNSNSEWDLLDLCSFVNICSMHIVPRKLPCKFFWRFSASSTKSKMAAKIQCQSLELELLHGFVSCLVQRNNLTLDVCWLVFCVIIIIIFFFFNFTDFNWSFSFAHFGYYQNLVIWLYSANFIFWVAQWPLENCFSCFHFFNKIQDSRRIKCYSLELELLHQFVPRKQLTLAINFGVILTSHLTAH